MHDDQPIPPGIYQRGAGFQVRVRRAGLDLTATLPTLEEAIAWRQRAIALAAGSPGLPMNEAPETERLLRASEVAALLGFAPGTIVDWAERGELPAFKVGGRLRFRLSEVEEWLEVQRLSDD